MKLFYYLIILLLFSLQLNGQLHNPNEFGNPPSWKWSKNYGLALSHIVDSIMVDTTLTKGIALCNDSQGNVYFLGYTSAQELNIEENKINKGTFLIKFNRLGNMDWLVNIPSLICDPYYYHQLAIDPSDKFVYFAGHIHDNIIIPNGQTVNAGENGSYVIFKYDVSGKFVWFKKFDFLESKTRDNSSNKYYFDLTPDFENNLIFSGHYVTDIALDHVTLESGGIGGKHGFIGKLNKEGELQWANNIGGESQEYYILTEIDKNQDIILVGEITSNKVFYRDTVFEKPAGDGNIFISKLNSDGDVIWMKSIAGTLDTNNFKYDNYCWASGIKVINDGGFYLKGWHGDSVYFDEIMLRSPYGMNFSYFISRFDAEGNVMWVNSINQYSYGLDYNPIATDDEESVYIAAQITDTVFFENKFKYYIDKDERLNDLFIAKYRSDGNLSWVKSIPNKGLGGEAEIKGLVSLGVDKIFVNGFFKNSNLIFDNEITAKGTHGFLASFGTVTPDIKQPSLQPEISIYPNPTSKLLYINFSNYEKNQHMKLNIIDDIGNNIKQINLDCLYNMEIDVSSLQTGVYFLKIQLKHQTITKKIIIQGLYK